MYLIREVAQLAGISVKTLHYYDKIGLLTPRKSESGYRIYSEDDLERLQSILYYKYLNFSLKEIAELLRKEEKDRLSHLFQQLQELQMERKRLDTLISTLQETIQAQKGERKMTSQEKFKGFTLDNHFSYRDEAIKKYGHAMIEQAEQGQNRSGQLIVDKLNQIFLQFSNYYQQGLEAESEKTQAEVSHLYQTINESVFNCSLEVFSSIGKGYLLDDRFQKNIDQFGSGTAHYVSEAIQVYVENR